MMVVKQPMLSPYAVAANYLTLDQVLTEGLIEVSDVSESGSVPELKVINKAAKMVLILDGEELVGAKQNRIVNTTILVAVRCTMVIPVSCVEQGRWTIRYDTPGDTAQIRGPSGTNCRPKLKGCTQNLPVWPCPGFLKRNGIRLGIIVSISG